MVDSNKPPADRNKVEFLLWPLLPLRGKVHKGILAEKQEKSKKQMRACMDVAQALADTSASERISD